LLLLVQVAALPDHTALDVLTLDMGIRLARSARSPEAWLRDRVTYITREVALGQDMGGLPKCVER
jgi:hypothetical protein